jgi:hypothetical protein
MGGIIRALSAFLYLVVTPLVATATGVTLEQTMQGVSLAVCALVFTLSSVLGLASLLNQLKTETPPKFWLFVFAHMVSSWAGGLFAFILAEWYDWNDWAETAFICACAYAGARSIDLMRDKMLSLIPGSGKAAGDTKP